MCTAGRTVSATVSSASSLVGIIPVTLLVGTRGDIGLVVLPFLVAKKKEVREGTVRSRTKHKNRPDSFIITNQKKRRKRSSSSPFGIHNNNDGGEGANTILGYIIRMTEEKKPIIGPTRMRPSIDHHYYNCYRSD